MDRVQNFFEKNYWKPLFNTPHQRDPLRLLEAGVDHLILLQYPHLLGMSKDLNAYMLQTVSRLSSFYPRRVTGLATVHPLDRYPDRILSHAFASGLHGVKLHPHVNKISLDDPSYFPIYSFCERVQKPILIHAGTAPNSPGLGIDTHSVGSVEKIKRVLRQFPRLKLCIPHLGAAETLEYFALLETWEGLYLDTTLSLKGVAADAMCEEMPKKAWEDMVKEGVQKWSDRVMFGTDWPNIPHPWDTELQAVVEMEWKEEVVKKVVWENARRFYGLEQQAETMEAKL